MCAQNEVRKEKDQQIFLFLWVNPKQIWSNGYQLQILCRLQFLLRFFASGELMLLRQIITSFASRMAWMDERKINVESEIKIRGQNKFFVIRIYWAQSILYYLKAIIIRFNLLLRSSISLLLLLLLNKFTDWHRFSSHRFKTDKWFSVEPNIFITGTYLYINTGYCIWCLVFGVRWTGLMYEHQLNLP